MLSKPCWRIKRRKKIKILRIDNGTEYDSNEFNDYCREDGINRETPVAYTPKQNGVDYCREDGIKRETPVAYTPEKNGVAERKNQRIMEATRAMLHDLGLLKFLWGEATKPSPLYMFNIGARIKHWTSRHPKKFSPVRNLMFHFRIFGCPVYFPLLKDTRNKLDASGKKGTFAGYIETSNAYRIYVLGQREVEISHDVTFDEDSARRKV